MSSTKYKLICGMEVHAELKTASKMFCGCKNDPFSAMEPNSHTCPVCLGLPGALPVPNKKAIEWTIKLGLALNCTINLFSKFDRKHYFYPDLSKGFQLSQYDLPFCYDGYIDTTYGRVRIRRIHLEEDTGKLTHTHLNGEAVSLIDFNRSGVPLVEIVTEPDITSAAQAKEYSQKLRSVFRFLEISDCDMDQGGMRLEANISLALESDAELPNYKVELKNINSFRFLEEAIEFEIIRQSALLDTKVTPSQETRGYNQNTKSTFSQRIKEDAADYRYFPEPDIPPIQLSETFVESIRATIGESPDQVIARWLKEFGIETRFGEQLVQDHQKIQFYNQLFTECAQAKVTANLLASAIVNKKSSIDFSLSPQANIKNYQQATHVDQIDPDALAATIKQILLEHPEETTRYANGESKLLNFFIGHIMRSLKKKIDVLQIKPVLDELAISSRS